MADDVFLINFDLYLRRLLLFRHFSSVSLHFKLSQMPRAGTARKSRGRCLHALCDRPVPSKELASVVRVFLKHSGGGTRNPEIVIFVEETTVEAWVEHGQVAPGINHVARGIKLDDRRSAMPGIQVSVQHVLPIQEQYMVLGIHAYSAEPSEYPAVGERLRPRHVDLVLRRTALRQQRGRTKNSSHDRQCREYPAGANRTCFCLHAHVVLIIASQLSR